MILKGGLKLFYMNVNGMIGVEACSLLRNSRSLICQHFGGWIPRFGRWDGGFGERPSVIISV